MDGKKNLTPAEKKREKKKARQEILRDFMEKHFLDPELKKKLSVRYIEKELGYLPDKMIATINRDLRDIGYDYAKDERSYILRKDSEAAEDQRWAAIAEQKALLRGVLEKPSFKEYSWFALKVSPEYGPVGARILKEIYAERIFDIIINGNILWIACNDAKDRTHLQERLLRLMNPPEVPAAYDEQVMPSGSRLTIEQ